MHMYRWNITCIAGGGKSLQFYKLKQAIFQDVLSITVMVLLFLWCDKTQQIIRLLFVIFIFTKVILGSKICT